MHLVFLHTLYQKRTINRNIAVECRDGTHYVYDSIAHLVVVVTLGFCKGSTAPALMYTGILSRGAGIVLLSPVDFITEPSCKSIHVSAGKYASTLVAP